MGAIVHPLDRLSQFNNSVAEGAFWAEAVRFWAIDEIFPMPAFLALTILLLWSNRASNVGPGGVR